MAAQMSSSMASNRRPFLRVGKYSKPDSSIDDPDSGSASPAVVPEQARNS